MSNLTNPAAVSSGSSIDIQGGLPASNPAVGVNLSFSAGTYSLRRARYFKVAGFSKSAVEMRGADREVDADGEILQTGFIRNSR